MFNQIITDYWLGQCQHSYSINKSKKKKNKNKKTPTINTFFRSRLLPPTKSPQSFETTRFTVFFPGFGQMNAHRVRRVGRQHQPTSERQRHVLAALPQHGHGRTVLDVVQRHAVRRHNPVVHPVFVRDEREITRFQRRNSHVYRGGKNKNDYISFPSAGPDFRTSDTAIEGSPLAKCGLSRPPLTAIPNP